MMRLLLKLLLTTLTPKEQRDLRRDAQWLTDLGPVTRVWL